MNAFYHLQYLSYNCRVLIAIKSKLHCGREIIELSVYLDGNCFVLITRYQIVFSRFKCIYKYSDGLSNIIEINKNNF